MIKCRECYFTCETVMEMTRHLRLHDRVVSSPAKSSDEDCGIGFTMPSIPSFEPPADISGGGGDFGGGGASGSWD